MSNLQIDKEFQELIPPLTAEEFKQLETNILSDGIREPIICWEDTVVDGHNRYKIAHKHELSYQTVSKDFDSREDVIDWMINNQLGRRNLSEDNASYLRGKQYGNEKKKSFNIENLKQNTEKSTMTPSVTTCEKLSAQHNVSPTTIKRDYSYSKAIDAITANTAQEVKNKMLNGEIDISKKHATELAKLEPAIQKEVIEKAIKQGISVNKVMSEEASQQKPIVIDEVQEEPSYMEGAEDLQEILESISMQLGLLVGQAETELFNLPKSTVKNSKYQVGACIQAIHKCAERLEISLKMCK